MARRVPLLGAMVRCHGRVPLLGTQLWRTGRGAIAECHRRVPLLGAIVGRHRIGCLGATAES